MRTAQFEEFRKSAVAQTQTDITAERESTVFMFGLQREQREQRQRSKTKTKVQCQCHLIPPKLCRTLIFKDSRMFSVEFWN